MARITIAGAGSIGCYVGGVLQDAGHDLRYLARPRIIEAAAQSGLVLSDFDGAHRQIDAPDMRDDPGCLASADLIFVCVKSSATAEVADQIAAHARPEAVIVSLQNGVGNVDVLRAALPDHQVLAAMVPFNVVPKGPAAYHRATSGDILVQDGPIPDLSTDDLIWRKVPNIEGIQWGKLLINLGNATNALSDIPLLQQLNDRGWRRLMADQMSEALRVLKAAGIQPAKVAAPPKIVPHILRLPNVLFRRVAAQMLTVDAEARSSMWDDLTQRRTTEIDALQGVIMTLGAKHGVPTPLIARLHALIKDAEQKAEGPPGLTVADIRKA
ncbi:MAG: 2-dehydropantoate 2-reductase [Rhodobacteraceae bacterium]|nr:2-dehydropantoate 2-reductase [Paracoccaceae bacterium]